MKPDELKTPHDLDAERCTLGSVLIQPNVLDDIADVVRPEDFWWEPHGMIYRECLGMHNANKAVDWMLVSKRLAKAKSPQLAEGQTFVDVLRELAELVPVASHGKHYAEIVRRCAVRRELGHAADEISASAAESEADPVEIVAAAERRIYAIGERTITRQPRNIHDIMAEAMASIERHNKRGAVAGIPTGLIDIDNKMGGLRDGELTVLAARPGMGKSALATNIAERVSIERQLPTLFVSLEMSDVELAERLLFSMARLDKWHGQYADEEKSDRIVEAMNRLSTGKLTIWDAPGVGVTEIAAYARRAKRRDDLALLIVDYLQLVEPDNKRDQRQEQVARMSRRFKMLARELKIPLLLVAQLNRETEKQGGDRKPRLSHLRESGAIEQDADVVLFIHRDDYYAANEKERSELQGKAEAIIAKNRNGCTGGVPVTWLEQYTRFENYEKPVAGEPFNPSAFDYDYTT